MKYLFEYEGSHGISARVVAYSISSETGTPIITFELTYPRLIHSELMTHREFSRNAASSRAIPVANMNAGILEHTAMPVRFGGNQPGMQDNGHHRQPIFHPAFRHTMSPERAWQEAAEMAVGWSTAFAEAGYHKQVCNRHTEAYQFMRTVVTFTGHGDNWFGLRLHTDADPTIAEVSRCMWEAKKGCQPVVLKPGDWHLPYYGDGAFIKGRDRGLEKAKKVSASCCAQASFRKLDRSQEKADKVFDRLIGSRPVHASPVEHQATPLAVGVGFRSPYVTAVDRYGNSLSGNFKNWGQWRQVIDGNVITVFVVEE